VRLDVLHLPGVHAGPCVSLAQHALLARRHHQAAAPAVVAGRRAEDHRVHRVALRRAPDSGRSSTAPMPSLRTKPSPVAENALHLPSAAIIPAWENDTERRPSRDRGTVIMGA
jgi:hypothetical protein